MLSLHNKNFKLYSKKLNKIQKLNLANWSQINFENNIFTNFLILQNYTSIKSLLTTQNKLNTYTFSVDKNFLSLASLTLQMDALATYTSVSDLGGFFNITAYYYHINFINILTNQRLLFFIKFKKLTINSLSFLYPATVWLERELQELDHILILNLFDTRRLLQDYTLIARKYNYEWKYITQQYTTVFQDLLKVMLCWNFYFLNFIILILISFIYINRSFIYLLVLTEVIIVLLFLLFLSITALYNIIFLLNLGLILLILGGLELALAFLLLSTY